jgi:hypothetical protein
MGKKNIHTVPFGNKWAVKKEGTKEPISTHNTKKVAFACEEGQGRKCNSWAEWQNTGQRQLWE